MVKSESRYVLIIAGGSGTRLWPMSRKERPKQLIPFVKNRSLIEISYERLEGLIPVERRFICASNAHRDAVFACLPELDGEHYFGEPIGRDTLPAIAYSVKAIREADPNAVVAVVTADHIIEPEETFRQILNAGFEVVEEKSDALVTFGIQPDRPATSFGYLELGDAVGFGDAKRVNRFKEKPDQDTADSYIAAGPSRYLWNSGMFVWKADTFLNCLSRFEPELLARIEMIVEQRVTMGAESDAFGEAIATAYPKLKKISVDFAIMEPASTSDFVHVAAVPMNLSWRDIGSWPAYGGTIEPDESGNSVSAKTVLSETTGSLVVSETDDHLIATMGVDDLIIVHTPEATLVCRKDRAEDIKTLQSEIRDRFGDRYV